MRFAARLVAFASLQGLVLASRLVLRGDDAQVNFDDAQTISRSGSSSMLHCPALTLGHVGARISQAGGQFTNDANVWEDLQVSTTVFDMSAPFADLANNKLTVPVDSTLGVLPNSLFDVSCSTQSPNATDFFLRIVQPGEDILWESLITTERITARVVLQPGESVACQIKTAETCQIVNSALEMTLVAALPSYTAPIAASLAYSWTNRAGVDGAAIQGYINDPWNGGLRSAWTLALWVKGPALPATEAFFEQWTGAVGSSKSWRLGSPAGDGTWNFVMGTTAGVVQKDYHSTIIAMDDTWHSICIVVDSPVVTLYTDGQVDTPIKTHDDPITGIHDSSAEIHIGAYGNAASTANNNEYVGSLDNIAIWNAALTQAQIDDFHTRGRSGNLISPSHITGTAADLSMWFPFTSRDAMNIPTTPGFFDAANAVTPFNNAQIKWAQEGGGSLEVA